MAPEPVPGGKEYVTPEDVDVLLEFNQRLMVRREHHFDVRRGELEAIFKGLDQFRNIDDRHQRILSMAAWILYKIAEARPFFDGNKTSGWAMSSKFLRWNGYYMPMVMIDRKRDLHQLLTGVQNYSKSFEDVRTFMYRRTITFQSG